MHFSPFFSNKAVKIKPESFFWWKIVLICHIACPKWIKIVDFRGFLHFRAENPGFRVKILKLQFLQKGSMKNFKNCTKQTPTLYIFMGGMSCLCSWKKLISPQKPTVPFLHYNSLKSSQKIRCPLYLGIALSSSPPLFPPTIFQFMKFSFFL